MKIDLTVLAIPGFIAAMAAEYAWQSRNPAEGERAGDYEFADTMASLSMGVGSLVAPYIAGRLLAPVTPRTGKYAKALMGLSLAAAAVATAGDVWRRTRTTGLLDAGAVPSRVASGVGRRPGNDDDEVPTTHASPVAGSAPVPAAGSAQVPTDQALQVPPALRRITGGSAVTALASAVVTVSTLWSAETAARKLFRFSPLDLGSGPLAYAVAILGWDFIYYWNHRFDHESRWLWAMHVVHHSSERYNLSTALRQPVAEALTIYVPYGLLSLLGVRPTLVQDARAINLIYQFWIHTAVIRSIGPLEKVFNSPSHHRVHHGSNREYLDRNHGSILIVWDRLFGTHELEGEEVVYGLTTNIDTFNPLRIATHEWIAIARDVFRSETWADRVGYLVRGPGWAGARRA
ncbi:MULTISPECIES: sterol desaturase family protein [unclassified Dietzia]|uniref:sterol desaturase family protein n=1 Tax=unclassified Dietzia TaxID=2617939 RepID=UPI0015FBFD92|nr:sterol desaturase family protein [Dietzia sp. DQ12-76]MBB1025864.1 sterol desaturase family protein [Dietzia sp. DQ12-76]MBB1027584.1 sterol desaturase family protein [Dietzia sp. DQ11-38-2]